jgi:hypothetical protein
MNDIIGTAVQTFIDRRAYALQAHQLELELAGYTKASDLRELEAIIERHSDEETQVVRQIVDRKWANVA